MIRANIMDNNNIGIVIGTFAAVPYIHLSLECLRKHESGIKILVHDDCSPKSEELKKLCFKYDASFFSLNKRAKRYLGDMSAIYMACKWSYEQNCKIGVKLSRRFIIDKPFSYGLQEIFNNTDAITVTGACCDYGFGFRSECIAFNLNAWIKQKDILDEMQKLIQNNDNNIGLPEAWYHNKTKIVYNRCSSSYRTKYDNVYKPIENKSGFIDWYLMGLGRCHKIENVLWHDANGAADYYQLSQTYNLPYSFNDFIDPNMGYGIN